MSSVWHAVWIWLTDKVLGTLVAGLVLTAFGSWWIARINERYRGRRDHLAKVVDTLRAQLTELIKITAIYWSKPAYTGSIADEAQIEFLIADINTLASICASDLWASDEDKGPRLISALVAAVVTSSFAVPKRKADLRRAREIVARASDLSDELSRSRHQLFNCHAAERH